MRILNGCRLFILLIATCGFSFQALAMLDSSSMTVETLLAEHIVDDNLRECLAGQLDSTDLLGVITDIDCSNKQIENIAGVENLSALLKLDLSINNITDIRPLTPLRNLESLDLSSNSVIGLTPLVDLVNLNYFRIESDSYPELFAGSNLYLEYLEYCFMYSDQIAYWELPDYCFKPDFDLDGIINELDNCPFMDNPSQINSDSMNDGGDACDEDSDNDLLPDVYEFNFDLNPFVADSDSDFDNDGLSNYQEYTLLTLPNNPDSDLDGIIDGEDETPYALSIFDLVGKIRYAISTSLAECLREMPQQRAISDIRQLSCSGDLKGIELLKGLEIVSTNNQSTLSLLNKLPNLNAVTVNVENWLEYRHLSSMNNIESLILLGNTEPVVEHIKGLTQLRSLSLNLLPDDNLTQLASLVNLSELRVQKGEFLTLDFLSTFSNLESLVIEGSIINDLSALQHLPSLQKLSFKEGGLPADLSTIQQLTQLTSLTITHANLEQLDFVVGMNKLTELTVSYNQISDVTPLFSLPKLRFLNIAVNPITGLSDIAELSELESLYIWGMQFDTIMPLTELQKLKSLFLTASENWDINELSQFPHLSELSISGDELNSLSFLSSLTELKQLQIWIKPPEDMSAISQLSQLELLAIYDFGSRHSFAEKVSFDLSLVANLHNLHTLKFDSLNVYNTKQLVNLTKLNDLSIKYNENYVDCLGWEGVDNFSYSDIPSECFIVDDENMSLARLLRYIDDENLHWCIIDGAEQNNWLIASDIKSLDCTLGNKVESLAGLHWLTSLKELRLGGNDISDLSPLENLTELEQLHLWYNPLLNSLEPIYQLPKLRDLAIDISESLLSEELVHFPQLNILSLGGSADFDTTHLNGLTELKSLSFWYNAPQELSFLSDLTMLEHLQLYSSHFSEELPNTDIAILSTLLNLNELEFQGYSISDLSALADLSFLTRLSLYNNKITDISALANLTDLTNLNLARNEISDISILTSLTGLTNLDLSDNQITDISALVGLSDLTSLLLGDNQISDISMITDFTHLINLDLSGVDIEDYRFLNDFTDLSVLKLNNSHISDLNFLSNLTNLTDLSLSGNQIEDISILANFPLLSGLNLENNQILDVSPLSHIYQSAWISLHQNPIMQCADEHEQWQPYYNNLPESCWQENPFDLDYDGIINSDDNCPDVANPGQWDKDQDGQGNACDLDIDGDGFANEEEEDAGSNVWNAKSTPETILLDDDNDGINNADDNCIDVANAGQWDKDSDGKGNACDDDIDGDGFSNEDEIAIGTKPWDAASKPEEGDLDDDDQDGVLNGKDNCRDIANQGQWDKDNDGIGNECDDDIDGDGVKNQIEIDLGTLPWNFDSKPDSALILDADDDGLLDSLDNCIAIANPKQWNKDGDDFGNECDDDIDGDGFTNQVEIDAGTKVWDALSFPQ